MSNEQNTKAGEQTSGDQTAGGPAGIDRNEGQTLNGTVGGSGSDLENASQRLGGNEEIDKEKADKGEKE